MRNKSNRNTNHTPIGKPDKDYKMLFNQSKMGVENWTKPCIINNLRQNVIISWHINPVNKLFLVEKLCVREEYHKCDDLNC